MFIGRCVAFIFIAVSSHILNLSKAIPYLTQHDIAELCMQNGVCRISIRT